jgi:hypothetical protein
MRPIVHRRDFGTGGQSGQGQLRVQIREAIRAGEGLKIGQYVEYPVMFQEQSLSKRLIAR